MRHDRLAKAQCERDGAIIMTKVTIFQFEVYSVVTDDMKKSRRWGTRAAIEKIAGRVLEDTRTEVDAAVVEKSDLIGFTERGFDPHRSTAR